MPAPLPVVRCWAQPERPLLQAARSRAGLGSQEHHINLGIEPREPTTLHTSCGAAARARADIYTPPTYGIRLSLQCPTAAGSNCYYARSLAARSRDPGRRMAWLPPAAALVTAAALCALALSAAAYPVSTPLPQNVTWDAGLGGYVSNFVLDVTLRVASPDCFQRPVILVSGIFMPTIEVAQGDFLRVRGGFPKGGWVRMYVYHTIESAPSSRAPITRHHPRWRRRGAAGPTPFFASWS